jgi:hypothetical protein
MNRAMQKQASKEARVIPIILRPCDWQDAPFGKLQALPRDGKPITTWSNQDEAWMGVVSGLRQVCHEIRQVQVAGIRVYCQASPGWPKCAVRPPGAPSLSYDPQFGAHNFDLSPGKTIMIPLEPGVEFNVTAYTQMPLSIAVGFANIKCTVREHEVLDYVYKVLTRSGRGYDEVYRDAQLVRVVYR